MVIHNALRPAKLVVRQVFSLSSESICLRHKPMSVRSVSIWFADIFRTAIRSDTFWCDISESIVWPLCFRDKLWIIPISRPSDRSIKPCHYTPAINFFRKHLPELIIVHATLFQPEIPWSGFVALLPCPAVNKQSKQVFFRSQYMPIHIICTRPDNITIFTWLLIRDGSTKEIVWVIRIGNFRFCSSKAIRMNRPCQYWRKA